MKFLAFFLVAFAVVVGVHTHAVRKDKSNKDLRCTDDGYCMVTFGVKWKCRPADLKPNTKNYRCTDQY